MNRLERRRPQIDPNKIRKHSHIIADKQDPFLVVGDRDQTDFGFTVAGTSNKAFETFFMVIVPNTKTPEWVHHKKTRVFRVTGGSGHYQFLEDEKLVLRPISAGDEIAVLPGQAYSFSAGAVRLELYVTQDAKYSMHLEELAPVESPAIVAEHDLRSVLSADKLISNQGMPPRSRNKRAAEQILITRGRQATDTRSSRTAERGEQFLRNAASAGVNASPAMEFSEEGAG